MAGKESMFKGVRLGRYRRNSNKLAKDLKRYIDGEVFFVCIGTDRCIGDSFAPFVGSFLQEKGYKNVIGTIDDPIHAQNLEERLREIPENKVVVAIDASIGDKKNIGALSFHSGSLFPGSGLKKKLQPVGDFHINGIVCSDNEDAWMNHISLMNLRLSDIIEMSNQCASAIESAFPLRKNIAFDDQFMNIV
ncbi:spore protease YyaC [Siminovitchia fordii]|uniref:Spore protease YyaC n=1 Tax=Siminovitchia fordii TaxID=254759 RepID=A0ABQ4KBP4_9BACI|nr:spore protease YyaC [Siminovitchia fordii]GIN22590.1 spore protease YyaC [Siminovitchia fordii]